MVGFILERDQRGKSPTEHDQPAENVIYSGVLNTSERYSDAQLQRNQQRESDNEAPLPGAPSDARKPPVSIVIDHFPLPKAPMRDIVTPFEERSASPGVYSFVFRSFDSLLLSLTLLQAVVALHLSHAAQ